MLSINKQTESYLTPDAKIAIDDLAQKGVDRDFALELLLVVWPEEQIYELPNNEE